MQSERVCRIGFRRGRRLASGYFITDRLILTAMHCLTPEEPDDQVLVLPLASAGPPMPVSSVWSNDDDDVALLELAPGHRHDLATRGAVAFGRLPMTSVEGCQVLGLGFPEAQKEKDEQGEYTVSGRLVWVREFDRFDLQLTSPAPKTRERWGGLSGTAVFADDLLMGVVLSFDTQWDGLVLKIRPIERITRHAGFLGPFGGGPAPRLIDWRPDASLAEQITSLLSWVDRRPQVESVGSLLKPLSARRVGPPVRVIATGGEEDEHHRLIERLSGSPEIQSLVGDCGPGEAIVSLDWPTAIQIDPERAWRLQLAQIRSQFDIPEGVEVTPSEVRDRLPPQAQGKAFWWLVQTSRVGPGHGALLRMWTQFWNEVRERGEGAPLVLILCIVVDGEPPPPKMSIFRSAQRPDPEPFVEILEALHGAGQSELLDELQPIRRMVDLPNWKRDVLARRPRLRPEQLDVIVARIENRIDAGEVTMKRFCDHATEVLGAVG
jgi:hypothetical protein